MKIHVWFLLAFYGFSGYGQMSQRPGSLSALSLSAYSRYQRDVFSLTGNPASAAGLRGWQAGIYGESRFIPSGLRLYSLALSHSGKAGAAGVYANLLQAGKFSESESGFVYAISLGSGVCVGAGAGLHFLQAPGYRSLQTLHSVAGIIAGPVPGLQAGLYVTDPAGLQLAGPSGEKRPESVVFGLGYEPSGIFYCSTEMICTGGNNLHANVLLQYEVYNKVTVRAGFSTDSGTFYSGVGFSLQRLRLMVIAAVQPQLGLSSSLMISLINE